MPSTNNHMSHISCSKSYLDFGFSHKNNVFYKVKVYKRLTHLRVQYCNYYLPTYKYRPKYKENQYRHDYIIT